SFVASSASALEAQARRVSFRSAIGRAVTSANPSLYPRGDSARPGQLPLCAGWPGLTDFQWLHTLRNNARPAVPAHGHTVEDIGHSHRRLRVRGRAQWGVLTQLLEQRNQAAKVDVVQRSLALVHDVEGTRASTEDGDKQVQRGQRLLAAGEQAQALALLV